MEDNLRSMGLDCIEIINKKLDKKITKEEYYVALRELHQKYPMEGHGPGLTVFQIKNHRKIRTQERLKQAVMKEVMGIKEIDPVFQDPKYDMVYENHLFPLNFKESAEMFIRHQERLDNGFPLTEIWRKREWPFTKARIEVKAELTGEEAEAFEHRREIAKERLPYKDE